MNNYWLLDRPIAHRGFHKIEDGIPENTLPAYQRAIDHNFNIELDVQLTKDGKVVVFHDYTAKRLCGVDKPIKKMTYDEFSKLEMLGHKDIHPPLFEDVLKLVDGKVGIVIELKTMYFWPFFKLERYLNKILKGYNGQFCIKSFNPFTEIWFFNHNPKICRGILNGWEDSKWVNNLYIPLYPFDDFASYCVDMMPDKQMQKRFHDKKKPIICWTVNSIEHIETVKKYADNIVFERLDADVVEEYYNYNKELVKDYPKFKV